MFIIIKTLNRNFWRVESNRGQEKGQESRIFFKKSIGFSFQCGGAATSAGQPPRQPPCRNLGSYEPSPENSKKKKKKGGESRESGVGRERKKTSKMNKNGFTTNIYSTNRFGSPGPDPGLNRTDPQNRPSPTLPPQAQQRAPSPFLLSPTHFCLLTAYPITLLHPLHSFIFLFILFCLFFHAFLSHFILPHLILFSSFFLHFYFNFKHS